MKNIFRIFLVFILMIGVLCLGGCEDLLGAVGLKSDGAKYLVYESVGDGKCIVSGITNKEIEELNIPEISPAGERVVGIGESAFEDCTSLGYLNIPDSVEYIERYAFRGCWGSFDMVVGKGLKRCGEGAFENGSAGELFISDLRAWCNIDFADKYSNPMYDCYFVYADGSDEPISELVIPAGVTEIRDFAFVKATGFTDVTVGEDVKSIGYGAFAESTNYITFTIGDSVESIAFGAFYDSEIDNLTLPFLGPDADDTENNYIGYAFGLERGESMEYGLTTLEILKIEHIESDSLAGCCDWLRSITLPANLKRVDKEGLYLDYLKNIYISDLEAWTKIQFGEFPTMGFAEIQIVADDGTAAPIVELVIGANGDVTSVSPYAFYGQKSIKTLIISEGVTEIGECAFNGCINIESLYLPASLEKIDHWVFESIENVYYAGTEEQFMEQLEKGYGVEEALLSGTIHFNYVAE